MFEDLKYINPYGMHVKSMLKTYMYAFAHVSIIPRRVFILLFDILVLMGVVAGGVALGVLIGGFCLFLAIRAFKR